MLNEDIVYIWQFSKNYWPPPHMRVVCHLTGLLVKDTRIHYLPGNHDELLRRFAGTRLGTLSIAQKGLLDLPHGKNWLFQGDVLDVTMRHARWLARLGAHGYDTLILLNRLVNFLLAKVGQPRVALSKAIKNRVKGDVSPLSNIEQSAAIVADAGYHYVACGHIYQPTIKPIPTERGEVMYLNSGDWILLANSCLSPCWRN